MQVVLGAPSFRIAATRLGGELRTEAGSGAALAELEGLVALDRQPRR